MPTLEIVTSSLPLIPDKRYFSISEVVNLCQVKAHVLRYWEQEFPHLNPLKRRGNRRYYQHADILYIRKIRSLLYAQGFTISGAIQKLSNNDSNDFFSQSQTQSTLKELRNDLEEILKALKR
jgi:DNA-binding transcriptional MerR regulator